MLSLYETSFSLIFPNTRLVMVELDNISYGTRQVMVEFIKSSQDSEVNVLLHPIIGKFVNQGYPPAVLFA